MRRAQIDSNSQPVRNLALNPSFELGSTSPAVRVNLCGNPSFGTNTASYTTVSASLTRVTDQGGDGHVGELTQTVSGGVRNSAIWIFGTPQTAGTYSVSFDMKGTDASFTNVRSFLYDFASASIIGTAIATPLIKDGNYNRYSFTFTAPTTFDRVYMEVLGNSIPLGTKAWLDRVLIEKSTYPTPYFDGSTPAAGDFTYFWASTAHASTSEQRALRVATYNGAASFAIRSSEWSSSGSYSCRHISSYVSAGSAYIDIPGIEKGKTYTVKVKCRMAAPMVSTTSGRGLSILMYGAGAHKNVYVPNTAGVHDLKLTFMVPEAATSHYLRLYNGAASGDADCWWDDLMIVEGDYTGGYVDGTKPFAKWDGTPHASTSVGYPPG